MVRQHEYDQHFLRSPKLVAELIGHSNIRKNDLVYDLGAGSGVITTALAGRVKHVIAIENEPKVIEKLRHNTQMFDNITIINDDIENVVRSKDAYKIFANPPFSLSSKIIEKFVFTNNPPKSIYLIVQKQFALKIVPSDTRFTSRLGVLIYPWYSTRIRKPLKRSDFTPPPNVDTVLLEIRKRDTPLIESNQDQAYINFVKTMFQDNEAFRKVAGKFLENRPSVKPSELPIETWLMIFRD